MDETTLYMEESARYLYLIAVTLIVLTSVQIVSSGMESMKYVLLPVLAVIAGLLYFYKRKYCRISDNIKED